MLLAQFAWTRCPGRGRAQTAPGVRPLRPRAPFSRPAYPSGERSPGHRLYVDALRKPPILGTNRILEQDMDALQPRSSGLPGGRIQEPDGLSGCPRPRTFPGPFQSCRYFTHIAPSTRFLAGNAPASDRGTRGNVRGHRQRPNAAHPPVRDGLTGVARANRGGCDQQTDHRRSRGAEFLASGERKERSGRRHCA